MLILSRKRDEKIVILREGNSEPLATVMVTDIRGDKVRLGIVAPGLTVHREEVWKAGKIPRSKVERSEQRSDEQSGPTLFQCTKCGHIKYRLRDKGPDEGVCSICSAILNREQMKKERRERNE